MSRRTKSVDDPPICRPALIPPTEYIAGVDHLPSKFWPPRQSKGPRPPLPPIPKPNFFTLGRMSTQSALDNDASEILLLLRKPCNTKLAPRRVSSSFFLSAANTGRIISNTMEVRNQGKSLREILLLVFSNAVRSMSSSFLFCARPAGCPATIAVLPILLLQHTGRLIVIISQQILSEAQTARERRDAVWFNSQSPDRGQWRHCLKATPTQSG